MPAHLTLESRGAGRKSLDLTTSLSLTSEFFENDPILTPETTEKDVLQALDDALTQGRGMADLICNAVDVSNHSEESVIKQESYSQDSSYAETDQQDLSDSETPSIDLRRAEPGDLSLIERINFLDKEIAKRQASLSLIDSFLKRDIDETDRRTATKSRRETARELNTLLTQKQQYEVDDHSLYGRSNVHIDHTMTHKAPDGTDFTVYVIEVRRTNSDGIEAGWIISRRYSQFNELHSQLKQRFPYVSSFDFPKKQLNRLKPVAEVRRPILESFLQKLLKDEKICQSLELRVFLSQNNHSTQKRAHKGLVENLIGLTDPREAFGRLVSLLEGPEDPLKLTEHSDLRDVHPAPHDHPDDELSSFAKPIVDLILEAFDLRERSKWIRKRAVVLVLQQILGGTIESRVRDHVSSMMEPKTLSQTLRILKNNLIMAETFDAQAKSSTKAERQRLADLAWETLRAYNPSYVPETAAKKVFRALQIRTLNLHLIGKLIDQWVEILA